MRGDNQIYGECLDANQTRLYAALSALLIGVYIFGGDMFIVYFLFADLFTRLYLNLRLSPLYLLSGALVRLFSLRAKDTDAKSKEFAAHIGLCLFLCAIFAELLGQGVAAFSVLLFLAFWKLSEAFGEFCFACALYDLLKGKNVEVVSL